MIALILVVHYKLFFIFRVKFRFDVEIKEFCRKEYELEDAEWAQDLPQSSHLTMGMTCLFCIAITVFLPWYIFAVS